MRGAPLADVLNQDARSRINPDAPSAKRYSPQHGAGQGPGAGRSVPCAPKRPIAEARSAWVCQASTCFQLPAAALTEEFFDVPHAAARDLGITDGRDEYLWTPPAGWHPSLQARLVQCAQEPHQPQPASGSGARGAAVEERLRVEAPGFNPDALVCSTTGQQASLEYYEEVEEAAEEGEGEQAVRAGLEPQWQLATGAADEPPSAAGGEPQRGAPAAPGLLVGSNPAAAPSAQATPLTPHTPRPPRILQQRAGWRACGMREWLLAGVAPLPAAATAAHGGNGCSYGVAPGGAAASAGSAAAPVAPGPELEPGSAEAPEVLTVAGHPVSLQLTFAVTRDGCVRCLVAQLVPWREHHHRLDNGGCGCGGSDGGSGEQAGSPMQAGSDASGADGGIACGDGAEAAKGISSCVGSSVSRVGAPGADGGSSPAADASNVPPCLPAGDPLDCGDAVLPSATASDACPDCSGGGGSLRASPARSSLSALPRSGSPPCGGARGGCSSPQPAPPAAAGPCPHAPAAKAAASPATGGTAGDVPAAQVGSLRGLAAGAGLAGELASGTASRPPQAAAGALPAAAASVLSAGAASAAAGGEDMRTDADSRQVAVNPVMQVPAARPGSAGGGPQARPEPPAAAAEAVEEAPQPARPRTRARAQPQSAPQAAAAATATASGPVAEPTVAEPAARRPSRHKGPFVEGCEVPLGPAGDGLGELVFRLLQPFPRDARAAYKSVAEVVKTGFGSSNGRTIDDCVEGRLNNSLCCGVWLRPAGGGGGGGTLLAAATVHHIKAGGGDEGKHLLLVRYMTTVAPLRRAAALGSQLVRCLQLLAMEQQHTRMAVVVMDASVKPFWALMGFQPKQTTPGGPGCYVTASASGQCARNAGPSEVWYAALEQVAKEAAAATASSGTGFAAIASAAPGAGARGSRRGAAAAARIELTGVVAAKRVVEALSAAVRTKLAVPERRSKLLLEMQKQQQGEQQQPQQQQPDGGKSSRGRVSSPSSSGTGGRRAPREQACKGEVAADADADAAGVADDEAQPAAPASPARGDQEPPSPVATPTAAASPASPARSACAAGATVAVPAAALSGISGGAPTAGGRRSAGVAGGTTSSGALLPAGPPAVVAAAQLIPALSRSLEPLAHLAVATLRRNKAAAAATAAAAGAPVARPPAASPQLPPLCAADVRGGVLLRLEGAPVPGLKLWLTLARSASWALADEEEEGDDRGRGPGCAPGCSCCVLLRLPCSGGGGAGEEAEGTAARAAAAAPAGLPAVRVTALCGELWSELDTILVTRGRRQQQAALEAQLQWLRGLAAGDAVVGGEGPGGVEARSRPEVCMRVLDVSS